MPLNAVHHLRETLNATSDGQDISEDALDKYDAPVLAAGLKLWLLELEPPLGLYDAWDEFRKIYPSSKSICRAKVHDILTLSTFSRLLCEDRTVARRTFRGCSRGVTEIPEDPPLGIGCCPSAP